MKSITQLFDDAWEKKVKRGWDKVYIMVDIHGVILSSNYHSINKLQFISPYARECLYWLSERKDVVLILWSSSHADEILNVRRWLSNEGINFAFVNENPLEQNTDYADFSKKPYFSILLDDKAGFDSTIDWFYLWDWQNKMDENEKIS